MSGPKAPIHTRSQPYPLDRQVAGRLDPLTENRRLSDPRRHPAAPSASRNGHQGVDLQIDSPIDGPHTALAQQDIDAVSAFQDFSGVQWHASSPLPKGRGPPGPTDFYCSGNPVKRQVRDPQVLPGRGLHIAFCAESRSYRDVEG